MPRPILYHHYRVCICFAPIFEKAKQRLKLLLKENILYTDGLRPDEISSFLKKYSADWFGENDLSK